MEIKTILVTGSSGTIGTRLCEKLLAEKYQVIGADLRKNKWNEAIDNLTLKVDLREPVQVRAKLSERVDLVIHLAANARVYNLVVDPSQARDNIEMMFNVLEYARTKNVKGVIFSSSREVYGNTEKCVHAEDDVYLQNCESPYTASKMAGEALLWAYHRCYAMPFIIFRFSNVYGMYDDSDRVVPLFIRRAGRHQEIIIYGKDKVLDFTYIDDVVDGLLSAVKKFFYVKNEVINLACHQGVPLLRVAELIKQKLNSSSSIIIKNNRIGEVVKYVADITKAERLLDYHPKTSIETGIESSIKWYTNQELE